MTYVFLVHHEVLGVVERVGVGVLHPDPEWLSRVAVSLRTATRQLATNSDVTPLACKVLRLFLAHFVTYLYVKLYRRHAKVLHCVEPPATQAHYVLVQISYTVHKPNMHSFNVEP